MSHLEHPQESIFHVLIQMANSIREMQIRRVSASGKEIICYGITSPAVAFLLYLKVIPLAHFSHVSFTNS